jgi:hypothetical protein
VPWLEMPRIVYLISIAAVLDSTRMLCCCMMGHAVWWGHHPQPCAPAVYRMAALFSQGVHDLLLT